MGRLDGKNVIITGAAQGMGAIHARQCISEGANVVLTDLQAEAGEKLASELGDQGRTLAPQERHGRAQQDFPGIPIREFGAVHGLGARTALR